MKKLNFLAIVQKFYCTNLKKEMHNLCSSHTRLKKRLLCSIPGCQILGRSVTWLKVWSKKLRISSE